MTLLALDLFCKAGGATRGLQLAGFRVTGVDIEAQPHYCGEEFYQADALEFPLDDFDFIWSSPPCQAYTKASLSQRNRGKVYPNILPAVRDRLVNSNTPWVIENTPGAPMRVDLVLCGSMFGLRLVRHRWFEFGFPWFGLVPPCQHHLNPCVVVGHGTTSWARAKNGGKCHTAQECRDAMGIDWMSRNELSQAIPPAYSEYIGRIALEYINSKT